MVSFKELKKAREENFSKLTSKINKIANPTYQNDDDRFWQPVVDKEGNGYAVIRYLPTCKEDLEADEDALPFVRYWDHGFKGPGGWYIENSLTSIDLPDPCSEMNTKLWNSGNKADKDFVSGLGKVSGSKRRLHFISNIYVVSHPAKKEDEGKVFLYKYGKKIFDKVNEASNPKFPDEVPINAFDIWSGANFKLKIRNEDGYRNYNASEFDKAAPLFASEAEMEAVWKSEYPILPFLDAKAFKTYDVLAQKLKQVMGERTVATTTVEEQVQVPSLKTRGAPKAPVVEEDPPFDTNPLPEENADDELAFFNRLLEKQ